MRFSSDERNDWQCFDVISDVPVSLGDLTVSSNEVLLTYGYNCTTSWRVCILRDRIVHGVTAQSDVTPVQVGRPCRIVGTGSW